MVEKSEYILSKFPNCTPNSSGKIHTYCPFHDDMHPSFSIDVEAGVFVCGSSSCGVRGTFPLFYKLMENISSWKEVYAQLKETSTNFDLFSFLSGEETPQKSFFTNDFPFGDSIEPLNSIPYLSERGIGVDTIYKYGLMYGVSGKYSGITINQSIVAPVWDIDGTYRTFQLRYLNPKSVKRWLNPAGSPIQHILYGGWSLTPGTLLFVVEGASDVWRLDSLGQQSVGLNTKEATAGQLNRLLTVSRLYKLRPVICLDGDASIAAEKLYNEVSALGLYPRKIDLNPDEDPGGLSIDRFNELREKYVF